MKRRLTVVPRKMRIKPLVLTPERVRQVHWKLDELVRGKAGLLGYLIHMIDMAYRFLDMPSVPAKLTLVRTKPSVHPSQGAL